MEFSLTSDDSISSETQDQVDAISLYNCIQHKSLRLCYHLMEVKGINPNVMIKAYGHTPFHCAVGIGTEDEALALSNICLNFGGNPNIQGADGATPLMISCIWKRFKIFQVLLAYGGDPYITDEDGLSAYNYACLTGDQDFVHKVTLELNQILESQREKQWHGHHRRKDGPHRNIYKLKRKKKKVKLNNKLTRGGRHMSPLNLMKESKDMTPLTRSITSNLTHGLHEQAFCDSQAMTCNYFTYGSLNSITEFRELDAFFEYHKRPVNNSIERESKLNPPNQKASHFKKNSEKRNCQDGIKKREPPKTYTFSSNDSLYTSKQSLSQHFTSGGSDEFCSIENERSTSLKTDYSNILHTNRSMDSLSSHFIENGSIASLTIQDLNTARIESGSFSFLPDESNKSTNVEKFDSKRDKSSNKCENRSIESLSSLSSCPTETLKFELKKNNLFVGPVLRTTKQVYLKRLKMFKNELNGHGRNESGYNEVLASTLKPGALRTSIEKWKSIEQEMIKPMEQCSKFVRTGWEKVYFTYILLDPAITCNLPYFQSEFEEQEIWKIFIEAVFYVGKGKNARPHDHLYDAAKNLNGKVNSKKIARIHEIWGKNLGVICLNVFHNLICLEAHVREAAMIDALYGVKITNQQSGSYYAPATKWSLKKKRQLGIVLLYKAMKIYLAEGETQIRKCDIKL